MYSRQEASAIRKEFWTTFGQYMSPVPSSEGQRVRWINYKTGVRHFHFRLDVIEKQAMIALELDHPDPEMQQLYFDLLLELKGLFESGTNGSWLWRSQVPNEHGRTVSRVCATLEPVSVLRRDDWPALIAFFKQHLLELDAFWLSVRERFEYA